MSIKVELFGTWLRRAPKERREEIKHALYVYRELHSSIQDDWRLVAFKYVGSNTKVGVVKAKEVDHLPSEVLWLNLSSKRRGYDFFMRSKRGWATNQRAAIRYFNAGYTMGIEEVHLPPDEEYGDLDEPY